MTLAAGFLALILAPEFFQPLRDLGTFYHAKAQAVGAADSLKTFLETPLAHPARGEVELAENEPVTIDAVNLIITSPEGKTLAGPLNFSLAAGERAVPVGRSGSGKSSLLNVLSGFLSYQGSLRINGVELRDLAGILAPASLLGWAKPAITCSDATRKCITGAPGRQRAGTLCRA